MQSRDVPALPVPMPSITAQTCSSERNDSGAIVGQSSPNASQHSRAALLSRQ